MPGKPWMFLACGQVKVVEEMVVGSISGLRSGRRCIFDMPLVR